MSSHDCFMAACTPMPGFEYHWSPRLGTHETSRKYADILHAQKSEDMQTNPDPNSYIQSSAHLLAETLSSKNSDYRVDGEFSNFEKASEFAGTTPFLIMLGQIGIKISRIQGLMDVVQANNEPLRDSLLDLAGYAIIAHAYMEANSVE